MLIHRYTHACLLAQLAARLLVHPPVLLTAKHSHVAQHTLDVCWPLALWVVTDPIQLEAQTPVIFQVQHGVVLAAIEGDPTPRTLRKSLDVEVRGTRPARRQVTASGIPLSVLRFFEEVGGVFLCSEYYDTR